MEIKEAIGYLQAVADNAQSTPKYQRALETAIQYMESYELSVNLRHEAERAWASCQNRLKVVESDLEAKPVMLAWCTPPRAWRRRPLRRAGTS